MVFKLCINKKNSSSVYYTMRYTKLCIHINNVYHFRNVLVVCKYLAIFYSLQFIVILICQLIAKQVFNIRKSCIKNEYVCFYFICFKLKCFLKFFKCEWNHVFSWKSGAQASITSVQANARPSPSGVAALQPCICLHFGFGIFAPAFQRAI